MKKILFLVALLTVTISTYAQKKESKKVSVITGTATPRINELNKKAEFIKLYKIENGRKSAMKNSPIGEDGSFSISFSPESENFYVLGNIDDFSTDDYIFYFKPGDNLNVAINDTTYSLVGKNTPENLEMERWHNFLYPIERHAQYYNPAMGNSTYVEFFPLLIEKLDEYQNYKQQYTANTTFNSKFKNIQKSDLDYNALIFLYSLRVVHPSADDLIDFYDTIRFADLVSNDDLLNYPYGMYILDFAQQLSLSQGDKSDEEILEAMKNFGNPLVQLDIDLPQIKSDKFKAEWIIQKALEQERIQVVSAIKNKYENYLDSDQKKRLNALLVTQEKVVQQIEVVNFSFDDIDGKRVSFSDFKGKYVYIDFWATWCAPCLKEIPFLKEIEEQYKNEDIVFVSISIDNEKDKAKWAKMVKEKQLGGVQLFAGINAGDVTNPYKISGIPHFMLFDKEGKIVENSAPRPSSPELKVLLDSLFKK